MDRIENAAYATKRNGGQTTVEKPCDADITERKFDVVLIEKVGDDGLLKDDAEMMFRIMNGSEAYPIEVENLRGDSSAMGFIAKDAARKIEYEYTASGLFPFIGEILGDMNLESEDGTYMFNGLSIYLTR